MELHTHAVSGEKFLSDVRIWELDGNCYVDFDDGRVKKVAREDLASMLDPVLSPGRLQPAGPASTKPVGVPMKAVGGPTRPGLMSTNDRLK